MNPLKIIKGLGKALRGGANRKDIFLGIFLGFAVGMLPGFNLTVLIFLILLLFLNTNGPMAAVALLVGKGLCHLLAPVTYQIGYMMIHSMGLDSLVQTCANTPVLAFLDLQVYCLIGALPIVIVVGGIVAWFVASSITGLRRKLVAAKDSSDKLEKVASSKISRFLLWLAFGKQKKALAEMLDTKTSLINGKRAIPAIILLAIILIGGWLFLDRGLKTALEQGIASANGAEVNIAKADFLPGEGRLVIEGLQVTNPAKPEENRVQAEKLVLDVSVSDLLTKSLVVELLECQAMQMDTPRETPGEVYLEPTKTEGEKAADTIVSTLTKAGGEKAQYLSQINDFNKKLNKLKEFLEKQELDKKLAKEDKQSAADRRAQEMEEIRTKGYLAMSAQDLLTQKPLWLIRVGRVSKVKLLPELPTFIIEAQNLSSNPSLVEEKPSIKARPDEDILKQLMGGVTGQLDKLGNPLKDIVKPKSDDKKGAGKVLDFLK